MTGDMNAVSRGIRFRGLIAPVDKPTGDRRMFASGSLSTRRLPRPANFQVMTDSGHAHSVTVGKLEKMYAGEGGWWGEGTFLDPRIVPEVVRAIYLLKEGVYGPSVDLDNYTYEIAPHPSGDGNVMRFTKGRVMGFTLVSFPAFAEVEIIVDDPDQMDVLTASGINFAVNSTNWKRFPLGSRDQEWNADESIARLIEWSGGQPGKYRTAFLYVDEKADATNRDSYRLPIADVVNGKLTLIPHAVYAAAALLSGAHGGLPNIPDNEKDQLRDVITEIYNVFTSQWGDPRVKPPWMRGGRDKEGQPLSLDLDLLEELADEGEPNMDEPDAGKLNQAARREAARRGWAMPDGSYPIRDEDHHGAEDLRKAIHAVGRGNAPHDEIRAHIMKRARALGLADQIPDNWALGGEDGDFAQTAASAPVRPLAAWFQDPQLTAPTPLQVDEDGRVWGHLAAWNVCHTGIGNKCIQAPRTQTGYKHFKVGSVLLDNGETIQVGKITLGGGHADPQLGFIPAAEHYDNSCVSVAVVNSGEDKHGIWVAGATVAGLTEERIAELRRSPLSGDWRRIGGNLELVAALAVNSPGFPVIRASAEHEDEVLLAAGVLVHSDTDDGMDSELAELAGRVKRLADLDSAIKSLNHKGKLLRIKSLLGRKE